MIPKTRSFLSIRKGLPVRRRESSLGAGKKKSETYAGRSIGPVQKHCLKDLKMILYPTHGSMINK